MSDKIAKAGRLLMIDHGSYSDYSVMGVFVVLSDFDPAAMLDEFLKDIGYSRELDRYALDEYKFVSFLCGKGLLLEIDYSVIHVSDYRDPDEFRFTQ